MTTPTPTTERRRLTLLLLGAPSSGKTALTERFLHGLFSHAYVPTEGHDRILCDAGSAAPRPLCIEELGADTSDTLLGDCIRQASCVMAVYSTDDDNTVLHVSEQLESVERLISMRHLPVLVVGTKSDLLNKRRAVSSRYLDLETDLLSDLCDAFATLKTSALTGEGVQRAFGLAIAAAVEFEQQRRAEEDETAAAAQPVEPGRRRHRCFGCL